MTSTGDQVNSQQLSKLVTTITEISLLSVIVTEFKYCREPLRIHEFDFKFMRHFRTDIFNEKRGFQIFTLAGDEA